MNELNAIIGWMMDDELTTTAMQRDATEGTDKDFEYSILLNCLNGPHACTGR